MFNTKIKYDSEVQEKQELRILYKDKLITIGKETVMIDDIPEEITGPVSHIVGNSINTHYLGKIEFDTVPDAIVEYLNSLVNEKEV